MFTDLRHAARALAATPGFTAVALIVLTLGIGATTAIFSVVDGIALKGLPFPRADRLVSVDEIDATGRGFVGGYVAAPNFHDWRARQQVFEDMAAVQGKSGFTLRDGGEPQPLQVRMVSASLFSLLRVSPALGAVFSADREVAGRDRVAVIGDALWRRRFNADPQIVGKTISFEAGVWEIVGVMPPEFTYPIGPATPVDMWVPYVPPAGEMPRGTGDSRTFNAKVVARLKDGVSIEQARAQMEQITGAMKAEFPKWFHDRWVAVIPLQDSVVGNAKSWMFMLLGAVAFLLLIACANVANLLLARATARVRDVSIRAALGATRWRLARGLLMESCLLSTVGTLGGLLVALWGVEALRASLPPSLPRLADVAVNYRVLVAAAAAAIVTGVAFGLLPAWQFSRPNLVKGLGDGGRGGTTGRARTRARTVLLVAEVAIAIVLLIGAGLFVSSFVRLMRVDVGLNYRHVLTVGVYPRIDFSRERIDGDMARAGVLLSDVVDRVRALPGVDAVATISGHTPLTTGWSRTTVTVPGRAPFSSAEDGADIATVSADYFRVVGVPVLAGRGLTAEDSADNAAPVVVLNDIAAQRYFGEVSPIGADINVNGKKTVVGIVRSARLQGPEGQLRPGVFVPFTRARSFGATLVIRTARAPELLAPDVRAAIRSLAPDLVIPAAQTMETLFDRLIVQRKFNMIVLALFGVLAIVIAGAGIYGVMAYVVEQRTREIGVRMALGAQPSQVLQLVLGRAAMVMGVGLVIGLAGGWMLARVVRTFLFQVGPHDPFVCAGAATVLMAAGLVAAFIPARRAASVDPVTALR
jgi:predicted permease